MPPPNPFCSRTRSIPNRKEAEAGLITKSKSGSTSGSPNWWASRWRCWDSSNNIPRPMSSRFPSFDPTRGTTSFGLCGPSGKNSALICIMDKKMACFWESSGDPGPTWKGGDQMGTCWTVRRKLSFPSKTCTSRSCITTSASIAKMVLHKTAPSSQRKTIFCASIIASWVPAHLCHS